MGDAGFFRGTSADQDNRFSNKDKKLMKAMKFESIIDTKVSLKNVNLEVFGPWITKRVTELLGMEDDLLIDFIVNILDESKQGLKHAAPNPKQMQMNLTGFLRKDKARIFMGELWELLVSAQASKTGIPQKFIDDKAAELKQADEQKKAMQNMLRHTTRRFDQHPAGMPPPPSSMPPSMKPPSIPPPPPRPGLLAAPPLIANPPILSSVPLTATAAAPPPPPPAVDPQCGKIQSNTGIADFDIAVPTQTATAEACCTSCTNNKDCIIWAWHAEETPPMCHLHGDKATPNHHPGCFSGHMVNRTAAATF
eukprot:m.219552 g.219552  ORF g.219552 m.219552 type:complete len:308 (+) comp33296_c2_seq2:121-1044(+)